jgi:polyhydroxybutyrate depolymerase
MPALRVLIVGLIVAACSPAGAPSTTVASTSAPSSTPSVAPTSSPTIVGGERPVKVQLPTPGSSGPAPLILLLHGYTSNSAEVQEYLRLGRVAADRGFVFAAPDGTVDSDGNQYWNATDACCDLDQAGVDDAGYLADLIDEIKAVANIDPKRIYVVGHSNGGFMSHRMACEHADVLAAIVSVAGATFVDPDDCRPSEPVAVLQIHGSADETIAYDGGVLGYSNDGSPLKYPGARATAKAWAGYDGCDPKLVETDETVDVDALIDGPSDLAEATIARASGCEPGGAVELWTIPDGGHVPSVSGALADRIADFLLDHPKP